MRRVLCCWILAAVASGAENASWALLDPETDGVEGTSTERAYRELALTAPAEPIIVAVIDSGVDIDHPQLKGQIWTNPKEAGGAAGVDDDGNGFVDDVHGWNFLGSRDGKQVTSGRMEVTRLFSTLSKREHDGALPPEDEKRLQTVKAVYQRQVAQHSQQLMQIMTQLGMCERALAILHAQGLAADTTQAITAFDPRTASGQVAKRLLQQTLGRSRVDIPTLRRMCEEETSSLDAQFGLDSEESAIIGDDPAKLDEHGYGNPQVFVAANAFHGTHVAGIIGAARDGVGVEGQCAWVRIMVVRAVPDGDERDKDVANAVRYAVENGARIINMSFGKGFSPNKDYVDAAFQLAADKGVLIVHGCGNDGADLEKSEHYPNRKPLAADHPPFPNWIEVGASTQNKGAGLAATFSNYGPTEVDVFAPGVDIESTVPGGGYRSADGTSMASPEVAGVAALVWSQHPEMTAVEVRKALLDNVRKYPDVRVQKPGGRGTGSFASLSSSGGIVDAYRTLVALGAKRKDGEGPAKTGADAAKPDPAKPETEKPETEKPAGDKTDAPLP